LGLLQGVVVATGLNPVLTTIAAGAIIFGVTSNLLGGQDATLGSHVISWSDQAVLGLQIPVYVFVVFTFAVAVLVHRTVLGRQILLSGSNRRTAELSGISSARITLWVFLIFGVGVAIAGVLQAAQVGTANPDTLATLTVDAGAAVLIGGTAMSGGFGSPMRSAGGAVVIALATNVMILNNVSNGVRQTVVGAVVVVVVVVLEVLRRRPAT
jgi:ribose transport system permease protein